MPSWQLARTQSFSLRTGVLNPVSRTQLTFRADALWCLFFEWCESGLTFCFLFFCRCHNLTVYLLFLLRVVWWIYSNRRRRRRKMSFFGMGCFRSKERGEWISSFTASGIFFKLLKSELVFVLFLFSILILSLYISVAFLWLLFSFYRPSLSRICCSL